MPTKPQLGSQAIQAPPTRHIAHIAPSTCHDLSIFKEVLREYRRLDDSITMRLNRANAAIRDNDRIHESTENIQSRACLSVWRELTENWKRRTQLVNYCVRVVDTSLEEKRKVLEDDDQSAAAKRKAQGDIYAEQVKRTQVHNELKVESIIRKRVVEAFRSRCQFFIPPSTEAEAREIWDSAGQQ